MKTILGIADKEIFDSPESAARSCAPVTCCAYVALCRHGEVECKICLREMLQETEAKLQRERQYSYQLRQTLKDRERKLANRHNVPSSPAPPETGVAQPKGLNEKEQAN